MTRYAIQSGSRTITPIELRALFLGMTKCQPIGLRTVTDVEGIIEEEGKPPCDEVVQKISHFGGWVNIDYARRLKAKLGVEVEVKALPWGCRVTRDDGKKTPVIAHRKGEKLDGLTVSGILNEFGVDELYVQLHAKAGEHRYVYRGKEVKFTPKKSQESKPEDGMFFRTYKMKNIIWVRAGGVEYLVTK